MKYIVLLSFLLLITMSGCQYDEKAALHSEFPTPWGAENLSRAGNNWATFEFEGKKFLYYRYGGHCSVTCMGETKKD